MSAVHCTTYSMHVQPGAVKLVLWRHWMHLSYMPPLTTENQFHCTKLYALRALHCTTYNMHSLHCTVCTYALTALYSMHVCTHCTVQYARMHSLHCTTHQWPSWWPSKGQSVVCEAPRQLLSNVNAIGRRLQNKTILFLALTVRLPL